VSPECSLSADPDITDLLQWEHPKTLAPIAVEHGKSGFRRTKAVISERRQYSTKVTIEYHRNSHRPTRLRFGAKINHIGWPWRVIMHSVSKQVRHGVVIYLFWFHFHIKSAFSR